MFKRSFLSLVVIALLGTSCSYDVGIDSPQLVAVRRDVFVNEISMRGIVDSAQNTEVRVRVESVGNAGITINFVVPEGTLVQEGDLLVELDSSLPEENVERQQIVVIESGEQLAQALADLENAKRTQDETAIEIAQNVAESAEEHNRIAINRLAFLQRQLANCRIYATSAGRVIYHVPRIYVPRIDDFVIREGQRVVNPQILLQIIDPAQMQVRGLVSEALGQHVRSGQRATIHFEAFPNQTFEGEVRKVDTWTLPGWGSVTGVREHVVTVSILNPPEGLTPRMTAEARIVVNEIPDALLLPTQAVITLDNRSFVLTFNEGKWNYIEIATGANNDREVIIHEGLSEGDTVVLGAWVHRDKVDLPMVEAEQYDE